jgi:hypothetical protein
MDPAQPQAFFLAWHPGSKVLVSYVWDPHDFPWLGIWEENRCRTTPPWDGETITRGMEFGVSPMPESRRQMIERGSLFSTPAYRWLLARKTLRVKYKALLTTSETVPATPPI